MKKKLPNKIKGQKFEAFVQKAINSGQLWFNKGDLNSVDYKIDTKETDKKSFRITIDILKKLWEDSLTAQRFPALVIGIPDEDNPDYEWIITGNLFKIKRG